MEEERKEEPCERNETEKSAAIEDASEETSEETSGDCGSSVKPVFEVKCDAQSSVLLIIVPSFSEQTRGNGM